MDEDNTSIYEQIKEQVSIIKADLERLKINTDFLAILMESFRKEIKKEDFNKEIAAEAIEFHIESLKELSNMTHKIMTLCQQALNKEEE